MKTIVVGDTVSYSAEGETMEGPIVSKNFFDLGRRKQRSEDAGEFVSCFEGNLFCATEDHEGAVLHVRMPGQSCPACAEKTGCVLVNMKGYAIIPVEEYRFMIRRVGGEYRRRVEQFKERLAMHGDHPCKARHLSEVGLEEDEVLPSVWQKVLDGFLTEPSI